MSPTKPQSYVHQPREEAELIHAEPNAEDGTYCPRCKMIYIGRETILGIPPGFKDKLTPITRCDNCNFIVAWDKKPLTQ